jgi:hypothetical protein
MSGSIASSVLDRFLDPVAACFSADVARRIVELKIDPDLQARLEVLATKANSGTLDASEVQEYEDYVEGIDLVAALKAKARLSLRGDRG